MTAIHDPSAGNRPGSGFVYPPYSIPFFAGLLALGWFAIVVWQLAQVAALAWLVWTLAPPRSPRRLAVLIIGVATFYPVITNLVLGQAGLLMVAAFWTAARLLERREKIAAMLLTGGALLKVFPLILLLGFAWRRRWRACLLAIATVLGVLAITMPWVGRFWPEYLGSVLFTKAAAPTSFGDAQSIVSAAMRSFPQQPLAAHLAGLLLAGCVFVSTLLLAALAARRNVPLGWAMVLAALPLTMPHAWQHYYVLALPVLWMTVSSGYANRDWWLMAGAAFAYFCLSCALLRSTTGLRRLPALSVGPRGCMPTAA